MGNSCIGLLNHKFFILYLWYAVYFCAQIAGPFLKFFVWGNSNTDKEVPHNFLEMLLNFPNEVIVYGLAFALLLGFGFMLLYQIVILLLNKTTMEVSMDPRRNPFQHKSTIRNIEMVFGSRKCVWLSPFHDPFPDMKFIGFTPSQKHLMSMGVPVPNPTSGARGLDYI